MLVTLMKAKLHRATVTQADLEYEGSIAIDRDLLVIGELAERVAEPGSRDGMDLVDHDLGALA